MQYSQIFAKDPYPNITKQFFASVNSGRLHHAWALIGSKNSNKNDWAIKAAIYLALFAGDDSENYEKITSETDIEGLACKVKQGNFSNISFIDTKQMQSLSKGKDRVSIIDQLRELKDSLSNKVSKNSSRVIIIDCLDDLSYQSTASLLKMIEEPPAGVVFLFIIHRATSVPSTILSRTLKLNFFHKADKKDATTEKAYQWSNTEESGQLDQAFMDNLNAFIELSIARHFDREKVTHIVDLMNSDKKLISAFELIQLNFSLAMRKSITSSDEKTPPVMDKLIAIHADTAAILETWDNINNSLYNALYSKLNLSPPVLAKKLCYDVWRLTHKV